MIAYSGSEAATTFFLAKREQYLPMIREFRSDMQVRFALR